MRPVPAQSFVPYPTYPSDTPSVVASGSVTGETSNIDEVVQAPADTENWAEKTYRLASQPLPKPERSGWSFMHPHQNPEHVDYGNGGGVTFYRVPGELAPRYQFTGSMSDLNGYIQAPGNRTWSWRKPGWT